MQEKIKAGEHTLESLPPYSPDLNPIEHQWAEAKSKRRKYQWGLDELFQEDSFMTKINQLSYKNNEIGFN